MPKLNMTFTVTAETKRFQNDNNEDAGENVDLELTLNTIDAGMFLFKICKNVFHIGKYKVLMVTGASGEISGISMLDDKDGYTYIIRAPLTFLAEVLTGYEKIRLLERFAAIAEYAEFQSYAPGEDEILDEFDDHIEVND